MASDPERIEALQHDYERRVRASKPREGPKFGSVLEHAPAFDPDEDARESERQASDEGDAEKGEQSGATVEASEAATADDAKAKLPKVPPDPRMRALHSAFGAPAAKVAPAAVPAPVDAAESSRSRSSDGRAAKPRKKKGRSSP